MKIYLKYLVLILAFATVSCAKRGSITGGLKDTIPPILNNSIPENFSTGFKGNTIRLTFNEYIKLKNLNKQLIVSPPMKTAPTITPLTASKYINIKINDTLQPNTTYSFNFGQSIEDNNESNPYPQFKYVFSTGSYIDSLALNGTIKDAFNKEVDNFVSVMLYEVDDAYTDSIVYKETPRYITNTLDSLRTFRLDYLKEGKYLLVALKDNNGNNKFDPKQDKIAFQKDFVTLPNDTIYELELFSEEIPFKALKPSQSGNSSLVMGYEGKAKDFKVSVKNGDEIIPSIVTNIAQKDSVNIWFPSLKADSLRVDVTKGNYATNFMVKIKSQKKDTLNFKSAQTTTLPLRDKFSIKSSRPLVSFDESKISLINKDSVAVAFTTAYDEFNMDFTLDFAREPLQKYSITMLPGAVTDFYEQTNDTLTYRLATKNTSDYGYMRIALENVRQFPVIVDVTNEKGELVATQYSEGEPIIEFNFLEPAKYTVRLIYDENKNREWDTGNFLERRQSEEVIYLARELNVRENWDVIETFKLP